MTRVIPNSARATAGTNVRWCQWRRCCAAQNANCTIASIVWLRLKGTSIYSLSPSHPLPLSPSLLPSLLPPFSPPSPLPLLISFFSSLPASFPHLMASLRNKSWECTTCLKSGQIPGNAARLQAKTELPEKEKTATEAANKKRPYETPKANLSALPKIPKKAKPTAEKPHKKSPAQPTQNSAQKSIKNSTPNPHNVMQNVTQNLTQKSPPQTQQSTPPLTLLQLGLQHKNSEMQQFTPHSPEFMQSSQSMYTSYQQYVTQPPAQYHNKSYRRTSNQSQS